MNFFFFFDLLLEQKVIGRLYYNPFKKFPWSATYLICNSLFYFIFPLWGETVTRFKSHFSAHNWNLLNPMLMVDHRMGLNFNPSPRYRPKALFELLDFVQIWLKWFITGRLIEPKLQSIVWDQIGWGSQQAGL